MRYQEQSERLVVREVFRDRKNGVTIRKEIKGG
jgi:hypothetical protein